MYFDRAAKNDADVINSIQQFSAGDQEALQDVIEDYFTIPHCSPLLPPLSTIATNSTEVCDAEVCPPPQKKQRICSLCK